MPKSIYLAGKIARDDWRYSIVKDLSSAIYGDCGGDICGGKYISGNEAPEAWPVIPRAVFGFDYTGPYFIEDGHGCTFGPGDHGVMATTGDGKKNEVVKWCLDAIKRSDIVFAWIDDHTAYGTLAELGYAKALGKTIWIAGPDLSRDMDEYEHPVNELWFVHKLADKLILGDENLTPSTVLKSLIPPQFDSPIEEKFWQVWMQMGDPYELTPQYPIGRYYVDFAYVPGRIAIELDGHATHSSPDAIAYDRKRQREIEADGWKVIRFGGKEIYTDAYRCAEETLTILKQHIIRRKVDIGLAQIQQLQEKAATISPSNKVPQFNAGDRAQHRNFGIGKVIRSEILDCNEFVEIQFDGKHGKKYLAADFAKLEKLESEEILEPDIPVLTIEDVNQHWGYIKRRCRARKDGLKVEAFLKGYTIVGIDDSKELPFIVLRANANFFYNALAGNKKFLEAIEWAIEKELKQTCKVRLLEPAMITTIPDRPEDEDLLGPDGTECDCCGMRMTEDDHAWKDSSICESCWDRRMSKD